MKFKNILLLSLTIFSFFLSGCTLYQDIENVSIYKQTAKEIFENYFEENYPDEDFKIKDIEVLYETRSSFWLNDNYVATPSNLVKASLKIDKDECDIYCLIPQNVPNEENTYPEVYTDKYFEDVKKDVELQITKDMEKFFDVSRVSFNGLSTAQKTNDGIDDLYLLPYSIRNAGDLFSYDKTNNFYYLSISADTSDTLTDIPVEIFFNNIQNANKNAVSLELCWDMNNTDIKYATVFQEPNEEIHIKVTEKNSFENEDYAMVYSNSVYDIESLKIAETINYKTLPPEDKEFLDKKIEEGVKKTDYIYSISITLKEPFSDKKTLQYTIERNGFNITYDYSDCQYINIKEMSNTKVLQRHTDNLSDAFSAKVELYNAFDAILAESEYAKTIHFTFDIYK